ncbi:MAG: Ig-like domain-containing protein, partial [Candidatus Helarchaeota archaeon]|nr:Ig-like domain-containing protein [Candidatus Helarchaeota archaeon]
CALPIWNFYYTGYTGSFGTAGHFDLMLIKVGLKPFVPPLPIITHPSTSDTVSGTVNIQTNILEGVKNVTFWLDGIGTGTLLGTDTTIPYSQTWDTTAATNGVHDLRVRVFDFAENYRDSPAVSVTVDNTPAEEQWVPYLPFPAQVDLTTWMDNYTTYVDVAITFSTGGYNVSSWGEITNHGYGFSANSEIWQWTGGVTLAFMTISHTYELGYLESGYYNFTFKAWGNYIKSIFFVITTPPAIIPESITNLTGLPILTGMPITIEVNISNAGGISEVWLNYMVGGIPQIPILMTMVDFGNGTIFSRFSGTIPGQPAGVVVNFSITVVDKYGNSTMSNYFSYGVVSEEISSSIIPMMMTFAVLGVVVTSLIIYNKLHLKKSRQASLRDIPYHIHSRMMQQHTEYIPSSSVLQSIPNLIFCSYCGFENEPTNLF